MEIYEGFKEYKDLINFLREKNFRDISNYRFINFKDAFYAVGLETFKKQIIIGREVVWFRDSDGYFTCEESDKHIPTFTIDKPMEAKISDGVSRDLKELDENIKLFKVNENMNIVEINEPYNCYYVSLGLTFYDDVFYQPNEFWRLKDYFNDDLIDKILDLFNGKYDVISINPFRNLVKVMNNAKTIIARYKSIYLIKDKLSHFVLDLDDPSSKVETLKPVNIRNFIKNIKLGYGRRHTLNSNCMKYLENSERDTGDNKICDMVLDEKYMNEEVLNKAIKSNGKLFEEAVGASEEFVRYIFKFKPEMIESLAENRKIKLGKNIIEEFISQNIDLSNYVNKIDKSRRLELIRQCGLAIKFVENPNLIMKLDAVHENKEAIKYITKADDMEIIIKEYPECIAYLHDFSKTIQGHLLNLDINYIKYFTDIDMEVLKNFIDKIVEYKCCSNNVKNKIGILKGKSIIINSKSYLDRVPSERKLREIYDPLINKKYSNENYETIIINSEDALNSHINYLIKNIGCKSVDIASGFAKISGFYLLEDGLNFILNKSGNVRLLIGSLREYISNGNIDACEIDKGTAVYINTLIQNNVIVKTYKERFYHGKIYFIHGEDLSCVIVGSSNISKSAFVDNLELNILFVFKNNSQKDIEFKKWYNNLWEKSSTITNLDENIFQDIKEKEDDKGLNYSIERESPKIKEVEREFEYLRQFQPNKEISNVKFFEGCQDEYSAFYFEKYNKMLVLDSLNYHNAIYIFKNVDNVETFLNSLKTKDSSKKKREYVDNIRHGSDNDRSHELRVREFFNK